MISIQNKKFKVLFKGANLSVYYLSLKLSLVCSTLALEWLLWHSGLDPRHKFIHGGARSTHLYSCVTWYTTVFKFVMRGLGGRGWNPFFGLPIDPRVNRRITSYLSALWWVFWWLWWEFWCLVMSILMAVMSILMAVMGMNYRHVPQAELHLPCRLLPSAKCLRNHMIMPKEYISANLPPQFCQYPTMSGAMVEGTTNGTYVWQIEVRIPINANSVTDRHMQKR